MGPWVYFFPSSKVKNALTAAVGENYNLGDLFFKPVYFILFLFCGPIRSQSEEESEDQTSGPSPKLCLTGLISPPLMTAFYAEPRGTELR